ncbi:hypothetical protein D3C76_1789000 [compost metagenome]
MNQVWLRTVVKGTYGKETILLQATQFENGDVKLSIHGLAMIEDLENFIDYSSDIFMEYLKYF